MKRNSPSAVRATHIRVLRVSMTIHRVVLTESENIRTSGAALAECTCHIWTWRKPVATQPPDQTFYCEKWHHHIRRMNSGAKRRFRQRGGGVQSYVDDLLIRVNKVVWCKLKNHLFDVLLRSWVCNETEITKDMVRSPGSPPGLVKPLEEGADQIIQWRECCADHVT